MRVCGQVLSSLVPVPLPSLPLLRRVPSGQVWAGNPAKFLRSLSKEEISFLQRSAANYSDLAKQHAMECGKSFEEVFRDKCIAYEKVINKGECAPSVPREKEKN